MIYITEDGTWGDASGMMVVDVDAFAGDAEFERILEDMNSGADDTEIHVVTTITVFEDCWVGAKAVFDRV